MSATHVTLPRPRTSKSHQIAGAAFFYTSFSALSAAALLPR
jgi:hypothetical protein